jgi:hypothetical protein
MRPVRFTSELFEGHKGITAVRVPFDPEVLFGLEPVRLEGTRHGWPVKGTVNRVPFEGYIGDRWGRFFITIEPELREAVKATVGDELAFAIAPSKSARVLETARAQSKQTTAPRRARGDAVEREKTSKKKR